MSAYAPAVELPHAARRPPFDTVGTELPSHASGGRKLGRCLSNFRHVRSFLAVCELGTVERAAAQVHRTRTAVVRSIMDLEKYFDVPVFERRDGGFVCNAYGEILRHRTASALRQFGTGLAAMAGSSRARLQFSDALFHEERLHAFIASMEEGELSAAAVKLGTTPLGICRLVYALERSFSVKLYARTSQGMLPTAAAHAFLPHAKGTLHELKQIARELDRLRNGPPAS